MRKTLLRVTVLGALLVLAVPGVALAHTTVEPAQAPAGGSQTFTVTAPSEKDIPIVEVGVEIPAGFEVTDVPETSGWESELQGNSLVWSGGEIAGGEEQEFTFVARAPQEPGEFKFITSDTYEDGSVSEWAGAEDSDSPASFVEVVAAGAESTGTSGHDDDHGSGASGDLPETGGISPSLLYGVFGAGALGIIALLATPALLRRRS